MKKSFRAMIVVMLAVALPASLHPGTAYRSGPTAISIDGETVTRIAESTPEATAQVVAGPDSLFRRGMGEDWVRTGDAPGAGKIVFAATDLDLAINGDHAPCLRGGESTELTRTEDGGTTWTVVQGVMDVRPLALWANTGIALGSSCSGFMLSLDNGITWSAIEAAEPGFEITAFTVVADLEGSAGPVVLFGETSEGGSSRLRQMDLTDPAAPVVSDGLRTYYGFAGLAAMDRTVVIAAIDGVWISTDAGANWQRSAEGLEDVVLEQDPAQVGLPADVDFNQIGLFSVAFLAGSESGLVVGSTKGLYLSDTLDGPWTDVEGTDGRIDLVEVNDGDDRVLIASEDAVFEVTLEPASSSP
jgi:hypothetical protein